MKNGIYTLEKSSGNKELFKGALYKSDDEKAVIKNAAIFALQELKNRLSKKITDDIHEVESIIIDHFIEEINSK